MSNVPNTSTSRVSGTPIRRRTVEHVFGTLKSWMGSTHFLTRTLKNVRTEMSLSVLAYNKKRMIRMMGVPAMLEAIRT